MRSRRRNSNGAVLAEFGPSMVVFICFLLLPLIDISFIPVRYFMAQSIVNSTAQRLCLSEKRSDANSLANSGWWTDFLRKCGVDIHAHPIQVIVTGNNDGEKFVAVPGVKVPPEWLPNGSKGPCVYAVELTVDADVAPLYKVKSGLPGFTAPVHISMSGRGNWENLGRNPITKEYYINE